MDRAKPFDIPKREVWEAYKRVRANQGAAGVDGQSIADFEADLAEQPLQALESDVVRQLLSAAGATGGHTEGRWERTRPLGIPTVADRIAQTVVKRYLEPLVEPVFHRDSYGYRPGKSALDAVGVARQRCWRHAWVLDLDIKSFFDSIDRNLLMRAVRKHTDCPWVLLYIERWLKAPVQMADGSLVARERGTPQGGVISPILANLFLHYAFDMWMRRNYPDIPFERYADDAICHCRSEEQARRCAHRLKTRFAECGLTLHPDKTKIVYCKDDDRRGDYPDQKFDFLGYYVSAAAGRDREDGIGVSFSPAVSGKALAAIRPTSLNAIEQRIDVRHPPGGGKAELGRIAADGVRQLRAIADQPIAQADHHQGRLLFGSLHRHEAHRRPTHRLAKCLGVGGIVLAALHIRLDQLRRD